MDRIHYQNFYQSPSNHLFSAGGKNTVLQTTVSKTLTGAPYPAMLRYYRCDTPYLAMRFQGGQEFPNRVRYLLVLRFKHSHLCDTPFCNISRDFVTYHAIIVGYPQQQQAPNCFAILTLQAACDMKSFAAGPTEKTGGKKGEKRAKRNRQK